MLLFTFAPIALTHYQADEPVRAIAPLAGVASFPDPGEIASIDVPTLSIRGTGDVTVPVPTETVLAWGELSTQQEYRDDIREAGHDALRGRLTTLSFQASQLRGDHLTCDFREIVRHRVLL